MYLRVIITAVLIVVAAIVALGAKNAFAKDVTLTLNDQEQKVFLALLDGALKNGGLQNLQVVNQFVAKFQAAVKAAPEQPPIQTTDQPKPAVPPKD